jgi:hypothetical protein
MGFYIEQVPYINGELFSPIITQLPYSYNNMNISLTAMPGRGKSSVEKMHTGRYVPPHPGRAIHFF